MPIIKNKETQQSREFWSHVEAVAKEVNSWPNWMGNRSGKPETEGIAEEEEAGPEENEADDNLLK